MKECAECGVFVCEVSLPSQIPKASWLTLIVVLLARHSSL